MRTVETVFGIAVQPRGGLAVAHALVRGPIALVYVGPFILGPFILPLHSMSLLPFVLLVIFVARGCAEFERELVHWWFRVPLRPISTAAGSGRSIWRRLRDFLTNPVSWSSLIYVFLEIPLGLTQFSVVFGLFTVAAGLLLAPFFYVIDAHQHQRGDFGFTSFWLPAWSGSAGWVGLVLTGLAGVMLALATLHIAYWLSRGQVWLAANMLSVSAARLEVARARAEASAERERADRSEQSRRELVVNVSHELRTPIASIQGHVEALLEAGEEQAAPDETRHYLEVVAREAERLGALVEDLLVVASADSGELRVAVTAVDVAEVAGHVHKAVAPIARRDREITVRIETPAPALAWADEQRLSQVLANLVRNAITYTPDGGIVSLEVRERDSQWVEVAVADTGVGIEADDLERIFDRFYRVDASRSRASGGFGLGLAISRDLVMAMGGMISVESQAGLGTTFTVRLRRATV